MYKTCFERVELKYMLDEEQFRNLSDRLEGIAHVDEYGESTVMNIYYDTPDYKMIRTSLDKPIYKEKLRLRTYGQTTGDSNAFAEIKKKYNNIVYKRRISMPYDIAFDYLSGKSEIQNPTQISKEIDYTKRLWGDLEPKVMIAYDRVALIGDKDPELRITFDKDIRYRLNNLSLKSGDYGKRLLPRENHLMELKIAGAVPLSIARILSEYKIFPTSYSKYGTAYEQFSAVSTAKSNLIIAVPQLTGEGVIRYA